MENYYCALNYIHTSYILRTMWIFLKKCGRCWCALIMVLF